MNTEKVISSVNGETVRAIIRKLIKKYPAATLDGLHAGTGGDLLGNLTGFRNDPFIQAIKHCLRWIFQHGILPITRYSFNERHDARALAACVERWIQQDWRYKQFAMPIPPMAFVVAAFILDIDESDDNWPCYKILENAIRNGYYSPSYAQMVSPFIRIRR
ncbi:hypothetical protein MF451_003793 [Salmonella enterica subsp. enterica serovar Saintpaul]|nr:hypothetical protein [Salmonella enterica subsp. enterica serovar Saintpaul]